MGGNLRETRTFVINKSNPRFKARQGWLPV
ncbi:ribosomal protein bL36 [Arthrobacter sp. MI7-26]